MKIEHIGKTILIEEKGERVLVIGDLHLGYEGSLRSGGVMIPVDLYKQVMDDFKEIFEFIKVKNLSKGIGKRGSSYNNKEVKRNEKLVDKIVLLGDLKHEFGTVLREEWDYIGKVLVYLGKKCKELIVIEGNHDKILKPILKNVGAKGSDYYLWKRVGFMHGDKSFSELERKDVKYWIMGHGHPAVTITDGTKKEKYKCFLEGKYKGKKVIVVPSFFPLIEGTDPRDFDLGFAWDLKLENFDVKVVSGLEVFGFGRLKDL